MSPKEKFEKLIEEYDYPYCSESDSLHNYETDEELTVKEVVIKNFKNFAETLNSIKL